MSSPLQKAVKGLGLILLGAAASLPVICLYVTKRMLRKDKRAKRTLNRKRTPAGPPKARSEPIRIPITLPDDSTTPEERPSSEPETTEAVDPSPEAEPRYVASTESDKFHRPECRWARQIRPGRRIDLSDREEALARDLTPCKTCNP
jgi:hypothetical protein